MDSFTNRILEIKIEIDNLYRQYYSDRKSLNLEQPLNELFRISVELGKLLEKLATPTS